ncbi:MAG: hypothetical protein PUE01_06995 [Clostridiaceae bacterium]|nr:hypothetical protein [Clostridiaceae bacterium]
MKKRRIISLIATMFIFASVSFGCNTKESKVEKESTSNSTESNNKELNSWDSNSNKNENNSSANNTENKATKEKSNGFFGKWQISKNIANNQVTALSSETISRIEGTLVEVNSNSISYPNRTYSNVTYSNGSTTAKEFEANWKGVTFDKLGIKTDSAKTMTVENYEGAENDNDELGGISGATLYEKDNNTMILAIGGCFFELHRQ